MKKNIRFLALAALLVAASIAPQAASAHDMWITCPATAPGQNLTVDIGYGHAFPATETVEMNLIDQPRVIGADAVIKTKPAGDMKFASVSPLAKGSYVVVSGRVPMWYTKSPEGTVHKPKNEVPDAISCGRYVKFAKAIVNVGGASGDVSKPVGLDMEIVPLVNPATVKVGGDLPIQVLLNGKPMPKAEVMATFAGFTKDGKAMAFYQRADKDGKVNVKLWHAGQWLVRTFQKEAYKDPAKCDTFAQTTVLSFDVK